MSRFIRNLSIFILILIAIYSFLKLEKTELTIRAFIPENNRTISETIHKKEQFVLTPFNLAAHFPDEQIFIAPRKTPLIEIAAKTDNEPVTVHDWKYVSTFIQKNTSYYYFKNARSNQVLELSINEINGLWILLSEESDSFILQSGEILYKVMKI
ncbi:MAG: hypothetical protein PF518_10880 [Spirochaetaceae bacterium]|nr:hypothetical protein [Spirochaetaceae bacterium]